MGTGVSLDVPELQDKTLIDKVFARLQAIDAKFSTYKDDSLVSQFRRGETAENDFDTEMRWVIKACRQAETDTNGYFSAWASGQYDPSGYVKGWAIAEAAKVIKKAGYHTFCIGIGGDILAASSGDKVWSIGIQDPGNRQKTLTVLKVKSLAVATSGNYHRGQHIINPKTGQPASELASLTVVGPDIIKADVLATAAFAMGKDGGSFVDKQRGYKALVITGEEVGSNPAVPHA